MLSVNWTCLDKPGALAAVAKALGEESVSIDRMRQTSHSDDIAPVLIVTHATNWDALSRALETLPDTGFLQNQPVALRIEDV